MNNSSRQAALEITNLNYSYRSAWSGKLKPVLNNINLTVYESESFGFLGQNGAGKTTTIKCILDLNKPKSGNIKIFGADSTQHTSRIYVGYLPEQPYWYDHLTVESTMRFYADLYGIDRDNQPKLINDTLDRLGILDRRKSIIRSLSKGLTQRLGLATTILHSPRLILLDEPFSGLDPIGRKDFRDIFLELKSKGTSILMSSHILDDVSQICDRASILKNGSLAKVIDLKSDSSNMNRIDYFEITYIKDNQNLSKQFASYNEASEELKHLINSNIQVVSFNPSLKSLEKIFIDTVKQ
jgi:ABC-2 type transport system ATP-binding protein